MAENKQKKDNDWASRLHEVYDDWGSYMSYKKAKLEEQYKEEAAVDFKEASTVFKGIAIFVNGYTNPPSDELRRLMMAHGGTFHHYFRTGLTTHMIASNLPYSKIVAYKKAQNPIPLCKPEWITDSIKAGKVLDYTNYLLYSQHTKTQPKLANIFEKKNLTLEQKNIILEKNLETCRNTAVNETLEKTSFKSKSENSFNNIKYNDKIRAIEVTTSTQNINEKISKTKSQENMDTKKVQEEKTLSATVRNCTKNSEFLTEFYNNSRLHHIATMGAMFKEYINDLRSKSTGEFPGLERIQKKSSDSDSEDDIFGSNETKTKKKTVLMHIDMDCFFVSVGLRNNPELRGFPIAVAHAKGNKLNPELGSMSEVASCSYEARKAGVKNGMFLGQALKLCPILKTIQYDFEGYKEVSYTLYNSVASYTLNIEAVSCDEMYVDCSELLQKSGLSSMEFAEILRKEIKDKTGCPVSTGFGGNKLQARLATKKAKPDGQFHLDENNVESYLGTLSVKDLPGVGYSITAKLKQLGVSSCLDLQQISLLNLQKDFGKKTGELLYNLCRGTDNSKLNVEHIRKSVSAEINYGIRFENDKDAINFLEKLSAEVCSRLKKANAVGRNITLKLMVRAKEAPREAEKFMGHGRCDYLTKTKNLMTAVDDVSIITKEVLSLWHQTQQIPEEIRGIGIQITRLESTKSKSSSTLWNFIQKQEPTPSTSTAPVKRVQFTEKKLPDNNSELSSCSQQSQKKTQTRPEDYFKKTKPLMSRSAKVELPSLQEIDMAVLVELPEDIRNEILNQYKSNDEPKPSTSKETEAPRSPILNKRLKKVKTLSDADVSFSQVDPEFLAALSEDMKNDVKMYCQMKKQEREKKAWNVFSSKSKVEHNKVKIENNKPKVGRKRKVDKLGITKEDNCKKVKTVNDENKKEITEKANEKREPEMQHEMNHGFFQSDNFIEFENQKFCIDDSKVRENKEILTTLVNCMLDLPLQQAKSQIQAWITNSEIISEIDFLSIVTYLGMLPKKKRIDDLHVLLKTMHRCVTKLGNCVWHETYKKIAEYIQNNMQLEYNSDLMLPPMGCNRCTR